MLATRRIAIRALAFGVAARSSALRITAKPPPRFAPTNFNASAMRGFHSELEPSPFVFDVDTDDDFAEKVINSSAPVIVDFHADWCGPCQMLGPRLEERVSGRAGSVLLAKINVDAAGQLAGDYDVRAVPTLIVFKSGEPVSRVEGSLNDDQIEQLLDEAEQN